MTRGQTGPGWTSPGIPPRPGSSAAPRTLAAAPVAPAWPVPTQPTSPGYPQPGFAQPGSTQPGSTQPGSTQPGFPQPGLPQPGSGPPPPIRPPAKHSPLRWVVVVACVLVICVFGSVGLVVGVADLTGIGRSTVAWVPPELDVAAAPAANAPAAEWNLWARKAVDASVRNQGAALAAGDEARYLAGADPDNSRLISDLKRRYRVLQEMGIGKWTQTIRVSSSGDPTTPRVIGELSWSADVSVSYCFGDPSCRPDHFTFGTEWRYRDDHLWLTDVEASETGVNEVAPLPWENADLVVGRGTRVVVASAERYRSRLDETVAMADRAAQIADSLAKWDSPPSRYVAFIAGPSDWTTWYSYDQPEWAGGVYIKETDNHVVINTQYTPLEDMEELLVHELTHVATMAGPRRGMSGSFWLIEGIAEYATMIGKPINQYDADTLAAVRAFVRGRWDGDPMVDGPGFGDSLEEASARYGIAFLAVRRIADVYGQDRMLQFFGRTVHDNQTAESAAVEELGVSWSTVKADCAQFIRDTVA